MLKARTRVLAGRMVLDGHGRYYGEALDAGVGTVEASEVIQWFEMTEVPLTDVWASRYLFGVRGL